MKIHYKSIVLYLSKKGLSATEIHNDMIATLGPNTIGYSTITNYLRSESFSPRNEAIENDEKLLNDQKNQFIVKNALKISPFSSVREIAKMTYIPKTTVYRILKDQLDYSIRHLRWVPHFLKPSQKAQRVSQSKELLTILETAKENHYKFLYTGDESWFYLSTDYEQQWLPKGEKPPTRERKMIDSKKYMLTIFWNPNGFLIVEALDDNMVFTADYFIDNILEQINEYTYKDREMFGEKLILHFDNARPHIANKVKNYFDENGFERAPQPPYSPDIAPSDFFLFGYIKNKLKGRKFNSVDQLLDKVKSILRGIKKKTLEKAFLDWEARLREVIRTNGEYVP